MTKEQWLKEHGVVQEAKPATYKVDTKLAVCLIMNPVFMAAAVAYSQEELEEFARPEDPRPRMWFLVEEEKIREVCGEQVKYYLDRK